MSQVMLPNSQKSIPKTNAERAEAQPNIQQAPDGIRVQIEDPEDPPGEEMAKTARVWKTYVREADRWDKEIVDGRNSSLDVLLIFAALFSAISTAFIIESLGDLKPDTAESSARSLLAISQKLDAIITGQEPTSLPAQTASLDDFSPSHSAVVVNILWLLSLSLSVAVSLIAMLAKEWCYKFMMGRSGPIYNQARKRQQKWNGIERWKMQELVNVLPGLMHAALLLFAVGLCIYLWDIHTGVAIVVTVVTAIAGCIYNLTTVLPLLDRFCPYSTPITPILGFVRHMVYLVVRYEFNRTIHATWLESLLGHLSEMLNPEHRDDDSQAEEDVFAHMDVITSQMLAWMIVTCEDSRSVDIALQSISGARPAIPLGPLKEREAYSLARRRVRSLMQWDTGSWVYQLKNPSMLRTASRYCRAMSMFIRDSGSLNQDPGADQYLNTSMHLSLFDLIASDTAEETRLHLDVNVAACLAYAGWDWEPFSSRYHFLPKLSFESVAARASMIISEYASYNMSGLSVLFGTQFLESYGHFMIRRGLISKEPKSIPNVVGLVRIFLQAKETNKEIAQTVSSVLAAAAFAVNSYPGGDQPSTSADGSVKRAVQVLDHHQNPSSPFPMEESFTFGIIGLLPYIELTELHSDPVLMADIHNLMISGIELWYGRPYTIPESYTWTAHLTSTYTKFQPPITKLPEIQGVSSESIALNVLLARAGFVHHRLSLPVLVILCYAQSQELQDICAQTLASIPIARSSSEIGAMLQNDYMIGAFFKTTRPADNHISRNVVFYFRLLVANIMLCNDCDVLERQSVLSFLSRHPDWDEKLKDTTEKTDLPNEERILEHVAEDTQGKPESECFHDTIQLAIDFRQADPNKYPGPKGGPLDSDEPVRWIAKLQAIKNRFQSSCSRIEIQKLSSDQDSGAMSVGNGA
ncbi:activating signal cointegrator 1 complex subunit 3 [Ceratobasidium sp. AG-Ba]|nr:activating signal cointegrator 1 complex subunit 3 [Ceratobasidium sp. AG-Ba]